MVFNRGGSIRSTHRERMGSGPGLINPIEPLIVQRVTGEKKGEQEKKKEGLPFFPCLKIQSKRIENFEPPKRKDQEARY